MTSTVMAENMSRWYNEAIEKRIERDEARQQRDEAREEASHWERVYCKDTALDLEVIGQLRQERDDAIQAHFDCMDRATKLEAERDEYSDRLRYWFDAGLATENLRRAVKEQAEYWAGRWETTRAICTKTENERDEARRVAARLWQQCEAADILIEMASYGVDFVNDDDARKFEDKFAEYEAVRLKPREEASAQ